MQACYAASLARDPRAGGRLELRLRVSTEGAVVDVTEGVCGWHTPQSPEGRLAGEARFSDAVAALCAAGVLRSVKLPAMGSETTIGYALHFEAAED